MEKEIADLYEKMAENSHESTDVSDSVIENEFFIYLAIGHRPNLINIQKIDKEKYDAVFIQRMWWYFKTYDKEALSKYPDCIMSKKCIEEDNAQNGIDAKTLVEDTLRQQSLCQQLCSKCLDLFYRIIKDETEVSIIRIVPNLIQQDKFICMRVRNKFMACVMSQDPENVNEMNEMYIKRGYIGNFAQIQYCNI